MDPDSLRLGVMWYGALLLSLTFHEAAHAWAARRGGDPTAYLGGQVSLDPRPHVRREPFGTVVVPVLSFALSGWMIGWASTPFDPRWALAYPRRAGWMSLAGPAANFALVGVAVVAIHVGLALDVFVRPASVGFTQVTVAPEGGLAGSLAVLLSILFTLNLLLGVFNLLPVPPLDGSGALGLLLPPEQARRAQLMLRRPGLALAGIFAAWMLIGSVFGPLFRLSLQLLYPGTDYR